MRKRILSTLLTLCMVAGLLPAEALAAEGNVPSAENQPYFADEWPSEDKLAEFDGETEYAGISAQAGSATYIAYPVTGGNIYFDASSGTITDCDESVTAAVIPSTINGVAVTSIRDHAFYGCSRLTGIAILDGVTSIGDSAFSGCSGLTSITIPDGVTSIGYSAFFGCSGLTGITIPAGVTSIGDSAFFGCSGLTGSITIPAGVTSIGYDTFRGCSGLTGIAILDGVTSIGRAAFSGCSGLISITIPDGVTSIGDSAFSGCSGLTSITIPADVTSIGDWAFFDCSGLTGSITIPDGVTSIGSGTFSGCSGLTSITVPDGVTSIGEGAFGGCSGLTSITLPAGVTSIGDSTFHGCSGLTGIAIPDRVTSIGDYVFYGCSGLTVITIPNRVTSIGDYAFYDCSGLTSITIPNRVTSIGDYAFGGCSGLTGITLPAGVTSIGDRAFSGCRGLTGSIVVPDRVTSIGEWTFSGCSGLTSITLPNSVTSIGDSAFYGCSGLTHITIPNRVTSIGDYAFGGCSGLTGSIMIPNRVTSIGRGAFNGCSRLTGITIPSHVTLIEAHAFGGCDRLTGITLPAGITSIGDHAFSTCRRLTSITIPNSVTSIGDRAFQNCWQLKDVYYGGSESEWNAITISDIYNGNACLTEATIHYNSTGMGGAGEEPGPDQPDVPDVPDDSKDISKIKINGKSIQSLFSMPSMEYNNDLALFAAKLSEAAEDKTGSRILNYYRSLEWPDGDKEIYQYDGDRAYSIACAKLSKDENLIVITARGSQTLSELFEDGFSFGHRNFFGYTTNDVIYDFERDIMTGLNQFLTGREYLKEKNLKILITGHSLGGAAANLNAARFTMFEDSGAWWSDLTEQRNIYCYTFGAINSLADNSTVKRGFENIHNVYNLLDSYGPNRASYLMPSGLGRGYGKFGHMDTYSRNYETGLYVALFDSTNHLIENYIDSLTKGYVSCKANSPFIIPGGGVWCPVDLKIYLETTDGLVLVGSITDNQIDEVEHPMVGLRVEGDKKYFYLPDDGNYIIELEGTGIGTMTYFVQDMNAETGEPIDDTGIVYQQVQLTVDKQLYSDIRVAGDIVSGILTAKVPLYVLGDDGTPEKEVLPDGNGTEVPITDPSRPTVPVNPDNMPPHSTGGYSSGGSTNTSHTIIISSGITGGTVTVSPKSAAKGVTVTLATSPNEGYELERLTVADASGNELELTEIGNGVYAFTMPGSRVTVDAVFTVVSPEKPEPPATPSIHASFTDVQPGAYYADAVAWAVEQGITAGTSTTTFSPDASCTRGQMVTFLWRASGSPAPRGSANPFTDVQLGAYYYDAVLWAAEQGITSGTSATAFSPNAIVSRGQAVTFLYRAAGSPAAVGSTSFGDVASGAYYTDAVQWAVSRGVTVGTRGTTFSPDSDCSRAQIATFLYRDRVN